MEHIAFHEGAFDIPSCYTMPYSIEIYYTTLYYCVILEMVHIPIKREHLAPKLYYV